MVLENEKTLERKSTSFDSNQLITKLVSEVLGSKFVWRILGFGTHAQLEIEIPDEMADPLVDAEARFYKTHPRAGQLKGDVRHLPLKDEVQIKKGLEAIKKSICVRFQNEDKNLPVFGV